MKYLGLEFDWPLDSNIIRRSTDHNTFGMVRVGSNGLPKSHQGWDFYAKVGTRCYSVAHGRVVFSGMRGDLGLLLVIEIAGVKGVYAAYAHLSEVFVKTGTIVHKGQFIAETGTSGNAAGMTGADQHLHFEMRTMALPGLGLDNRFSPLKVFGRCPLREPIPRERLDVV